MHEDKLQHLELAEVIVKCRNEACREAGSGRGYCLELFRRAVEGDQNAWRAVERQYAPLVQTWVAPGANREEIDPLVRDTLARFWRKLAASSTPLSDRFDGVGQLLSYLQKCATTARLDHQRQARRLERLREKVRDAPASEAEDAGRDQLERLCHLEGIRQVRQWVKESITDPVEIRVLQLSFEQDLSPAEIVAHLPDEFPDLQEVRRIKERVVKRLRRTFGAQEE